MELSPFLPDRWMEQKSAAHPPIEHHLASSTGPAGTRRERRRTARSYFTVCGNALGERLAVLALKHSQEIYGRARRVASQNLQLPDRLLAEPSEGIEWIRPRGGMTAFPSLALGADAREFCRRRAQTGVRIAPGDCLGQPSHARVGFAASGERSPLAAERLAALLQAEARRPAADRSLTLAGHQTEEA